MQSHKGSNGTPLDPPLFWLDNIFKYAPLTIYPLLHTKLECRSTVHARESSVQTFKKMYLGGMKLIKGTMKINRVPFSSVVCGIAQLGAA
jgi:hypothetical protein